MKTFKAALIITAAVLSTRFAFAQTEPTDKPETLAQHNNRMGWWREAKFGMFIHWGVYSVPAGYYHGIPVPGVNGG